MYKTLTNTSFSEMGIYRWTGSRTHFEQSPNSVRPDIQHDSDFAAPVEPGVPVDVLPALDSRSTAPLPLSTFRPSRQFRASTPHVPQAQAQIDKRFPYTDLDTYRQQIRGQLSELTQEPSNRATAASPDARLGSFPEAKSGNIREIWQRDNRSDKTASIRPHIYDSPATRSGNALLIQTQKAPVRHPSENTRLVGNASTIPPRTAITHCTNPPFPRSLQEASVQHGKHTIRTPSTAHTAAYPPPGPAYSCHQTQSNGRPVTGYQVPTKAPAYIPAPTTYVPRPAARYSAPPGLNTRPGQFPLEVFDNILRNPFQPVCEGCRQEMQLDCPRSDRHWAGCQRARWQR